jgi:drug/metabolite transporter (DMT)-like permease
MTSPSRLTAVLQALLVTFLWSTSWVLIKFGLQNNLPALSFAGLRYGLAFVCLIPFVLANPRERAILKNLSRADWWRLGWLGLVLIAFAQGAQFVSLAYLPAVMVNLLLNLSPIVVGLMSMFWWREHPTGLQWLGILLGLTGTLVYFLPINLPGAQWLGALAALVGVFSNSAATLMGRQANLQSHLSPLTVTFVSMGIGAGLMLLAGGLTQGLGTPSLTDWGIIAWLALANTAFAFTLWNNTQRTLTPVESSIINSLMMPQIALLAWLFLGESISLKELCGLALVAGGVLIVQIKK